MTQVAANLPISGAEAICGTEHAVTDQPLRIVVWGTYDTSKPRTRILLDGLAQIGTEVVEIHSDVWSSDADKSQLSMPQMALRLLQVLLAYPILIFRYLRAPGHDLVIVPYLGQFDAIVLWPFAKLRHAPVVLDLFLSLYDTVVIDRKMISPKSPLAAMLRLVERLSCKAADLVLLDTQVHARRIAELLGLSAKKFDAIPVGAEPDAFANTPARRPHDGPIRVLFYGQLIPLHGIETILKAARSERGKAVHWHIIGSGQEQPKVEQALSGGDARNITWDAWMPYEALTKSIEKADVCLGIFGTSDKAASVVPNKVYQSLIAGRSVITRDGPAVREVFQHGDPALQLVPAADADALLDAIDNLEVEGFPAMPADYLTVAEPAEIAATLNNKIKMLIRRT